MNLASVQHESLRKLIMYVLSGQQHQKRSACALFEIFLELLSSTIAVSIAAQETEEAA